MVYRFKLVSDEVSNFSREIEADSENTFLQLRNAILDSVDFTKDELDSFFLCDEDWNKQDEITLEDMGDSSSDRDIWLMDETPLGELLEEEGQRLIFVFEYMTERSFFMELKEIMPSRHLSEPVCTLKRGKGPHQTVNLEEFEKKLDLNAQEKMIDYDLDIYPTDEYNPEELEDGYDISEI